MIITKMGLRIQDRGEVIKGAPVVEPGDDLFWFNRPGLLLFLIHLLIFQNAFQLAFFSWSAYEFSINSCFHETTVDIVIRLTSGVVIQFLSSYATLPLYALVTQMGSTMKPTIFNERVVEALKKWHNSAKKQVKHNKNSETNSPLSSKPSTPTHGLSPIHLLHRHPYGQSDSLKISPRTSNYENEQLDVDTSNSPSKNPTGAYEIEIQMPVVETTVSTTELSFDKRQIGND